MLIFFTALQTFIAIKQKKPCLRTKYCDLQNMLSDPFLDIAENSSVIKAVLSAYVFKLIVELIVSTR